ncbi:TniQ family protein [Streptomyces sp. NBC_00258]|uniref:TniQ family protein n=1 Tax=Streptomyces sp. NBC_00258 TaxID=2903642 RepID=UPI002E2B383E|nr:TniQ family protein [Streptomyces sp. NBC_00258]
MSPTTSRAARSNRPEATALTLARLACTCPALRQVRSDTARIGGTALANWAMAASSRYCPQCLSGDGRAIQNAYGGPWQLRWYRPVVFACVQHHCLLKYTCPACTRPLNSPERKRHSLIKQPTISRHPTQCCNPLIPGGSRSTMPGRFTTAVACGARLDAESIGSQPSVAASDLRQLIALQERLAQALAPEPPGEIGEVKDPYFFPDLIATTHLLKLSQPPGAAACPDALATCVDECAASTIKAITAQQTPQGIRTPLGLSVGGVQRHGGCVDAHEVNRSRAA